MRAREIVQAAGLAVGLVVAPQCVLAQGANPGLRVGRQSTIHCPGAGRQTILFLINGDGFSQTGPAQTIAAGTVMQMAFTAPVTNSGGVSTFRDIGLMVTLSFSGNVLTVTFRTNTTLPYDFFLSFAPMLDLRGVPSGTPIAVTVTTNPANAVTFVGGANSGAIGIVDTAACQPAPASAFTIADLAGTCPSAQEVAAFRAALDLRFESDASAGTLVCRAAEGSADLTRLQERTYQVLRLMQFLPFDTPLPWTAKSLYDWFTGAIRGIRFRGDISGPFCCDPPGFINFGVNLGILDPRIPDPDSLVSLAGVFVHEARHNETGPHTCGPSDRTLTELGAWGLHSYFNEWAAFRVGSFLTPKTPAPVPVSYRQVAWGLALSLFNFVCDLGGGVVASPLQVDFGTQPVGAASAPRSVAITLTLGGPVTIGAVSLSGAQAADFSVTSPPCAGTTLPPSCAVAVRFTPSAAGLRTAQLTAALSNGLRRTVELRGTGGPGLTCAYSLSSASSTFRSSGGPGTVAVRTPAGCGWAAASGANWLSIASGRFGGGNGTVAYVASPNAAYSARQGTLSIAGQTFTVTQEAALRPAPQSITNAASFLPGVTPGGIATIFGTSLTRDLTGIVVAAGVPLPTELAGTSVEVNGVAAPLFAVANVGGSEQVNLQIPYEAAAQSTATVVVIANGLRSAALTAPVLAAHPGIFMVGGTAGAILHGADNQPVTAANPAARDEIVLIFATGLGPVNPAPRTGEAAAATPLSLTALTPVVVIFDGSRGVGAGVLFSGLAPGFVGLYQLNVRIPANAPTGVVSVVVGAGGTNSQPATLVIN